jgi:hypothetical protein
VWLRYIDRCQNCVLHSQRRALAIVPGRIQQALGIEKLAVRVLRLADAVSVEHQHIARAVLRYRAFLGRPIVLAETGAS